jgi:hypothetical protein
MATLDPIEERKGIYIRSFMNWLSDKGYGLYELDEPDGDPTYGPLDIDERYELLEHWLED